MKICYIVPWFPSLNPTTLDSRQGIFEYRQVLKLSEKGLKFKIISIKWAGQLELEKINDNIEVHRIPFLFKFGTIRYPIPNSIKQIKKINEICNNWNPDVIVYTHIIYLTTLPIIFLKNKFPTIVTTDVFPGINWWYGNKIVDSIGFFIFKNIGKYVFKTGKWYSIFKFGFI